MSRSHGVASGFGAQAWAAVARTPPYYPDAVTLVPGADPDALAARIDTTTPGASVKDSFADLDLTEAGYPAPVRRPVDPPPGGRALLPSGSSAGTWWRTGHAEQVGALAWDDEGGAADLFRPELLDDPDTFVLAGHSADGRVITGAVASRGDRVVGISTSSPAREAPSWPRRPPRCGARLFADLPVIVRRHERLAAAIDQLPAGRPAPGAGCTGDRQSQDDHSGTPVVAVTMARGLPTPTEAETADGTEQCATTSRWRSALHAVGRTPRAVASTRQPQAEQDQLAGIVTRRDPTALARHAQRPTPDDARHPSPPAPAPPAPRQLVRAASRIRSATSFGRDTATACEAPSTSTIVASPARSAPKRSTWG
ncbi:hypothetical protein SALBM311S_05892 [Streptomyces alboniger]